MNLALGFASHMFSVYLTVVTGSSHKQYVNRWAWLCSNKTLFIKTGGGQDLAVGHVCQSLVRLEHGGEKI